MDDVIEKNDEEDAAPAADDAARTHPPSWSPSSPKIECTSMRLIIFQSSSMVLPLSSNAHIAIFICETIESVAHTSIGCRRCVLFPGWRNNVTDDLTQSVESVVADDDDSW